MITVNSETSELSLDEILPTRAKPVTLDRSGLSGTEKDVLHTALKLLFGNGFRVVYNGYGQLKSATLGYKTYNYSELRIQLRLRLTDRTIQLISTRTMGIK